jgi:hypothetical protein
VRDDLDKLACDPFWINENFKILHSFHNFTILQSLKFQGTIFRLLKIYFFIKLGGSVLCLAIREAN